MGMVRKWAIIVLLPMLCLMLLGCAGTGGAGPTTSSETPALIEKENAPASIKKPKIVNVELARRKVQSREALLVCAYSLDETFEKMQLEGAISLSTLESRLATVPKDREIIFYCA